MRKSARARRWWPIFLAGAVALPACRARRDASGPEEATGATAEPAPSGAAVVLRPAAPGSFTGVVDELRPSIVHIASTAPVTGGPDERAPGGSAGTALGSGFVVDRDGHILTNDHVIARAPKIRVVLADGSAHDATVVGRDPKLDLALLRITPMASLAPARLGSSSSLRVGEWVLALGNPYGGEVNASAGVVSSLGRDEELVGKQPAYGSFFRTDARIDAMTSGGPVVNVAGQVIGIAAAVEGERTSSGYVIPIDRAKQVLPMLQKDGVVTRSFIGIYIHPVDAARAEALGLSPGTGALVGDLVQPGPGAKAGLQVGDVITHLDGKPVDHRSLPARTATAAIGKPLEVTVRRDGAERTVQIVPEKMPD